MLKGKPLKFGDTIGLTAPASPAKREKTIMAIDAVERLGFRVKVGSSCFQEYGGYLAGKPENRAAELNAFFQDNQIDAILCLRGGYGSPQILDRLDYSLIAEHPKLFIGYSDMTALHTALLQKCGLITIHGPMAASDLLDADSFTKQSFLRVLTDPDPLWEISNPIETRIESLTAGTATGEIVGGNLALICALLGTPYELDTKGKLLFLEDIGEEPYRIDRMLTQLTLAGKLDDAAGFILGSWTDCESEEEPGGFSVMDVFQNILKPLGKPTIYNVAAGHCDTKISLPLGVQAKLDATNQTLTLLESATA
ncbi:LD-carboxypeptidase [Camelliibacillus cellulosilyticus]|uniref:LD-carboxypeptidase n=1 Tax=Camelliibacillus cellulosilyticus TaxID=2174486 RepID=A0ABV9GPX5_9BACL